MKGSLATERSCGDAKFVDDSSIIIVAITKMSSVGK